MNVLVTPSRDANEYKWFAVGTRRRRRHNCVTKERFARESTIYSKALRLGRQEGERGGDEEEGEAEEGAEKEKEEEAEEEKEEEEQEKKIQDEDKDRQKRKKSSEKKEQ